MSSESENYNLKILYEVKIAKWRIDDQMIPENQEWRLCVFDRNQGKWVIVSTLSPSEGAKVVMMEISKE